MQTAANEDINLPQKTLSDSIYNVKIGAIYIRVSTDKQEELSPDAQLRLGLDYARNNGILIPQEYIFMDSGISGRKAEKRHKFQRMIALAKSNDHPIDVILIWRFSRFARNQEESIVYKSLLRKNNVDVISISEPIIEGPFGALIERIIEWSDEYYSIQLSEDVKRGMTEKALRGGYQAGPPFGYVIKDGILRPDKDKAKIIKNIFDMYLFHGQSFYSIARILNNMGLRTNRGNLFENRTIRYFIQNPVYKGYVRWNPDGKHDFREPKNIPTDLIVKMGEHEPIITEEVWDKANEKLLKEYRPRYYKPSATYRHWLSGVLICSACNSSLVSGGASGGFQCSSYAKGKCKVSHYINHKKIETAVITALRILSESYDDDYEILSIDDSAENTEFTESILRKLDVKEQRMKEAYINGVDTLEEYKANKQKIEDERAGLKNQIAASQEIKKMEMSKKSKEIIMNNPKTIYSIVTSDEDKEKKNTAAKSVIKNIRYDKKDEHIDVFLHYS